MKFGVTMPTSTDIEFSRMGGKKGTFGVRDMSCPIWRQVTQDPCTCVTSDMMGLRNHIWFVPSVTTGI